MSEVKEEDNLKTRVESFQKAMIIRAGVLNAILIIIFGVGVFIISLSELENKKAISTNQSVVVLLITIFTLVSTNLTRVDVLKWFGKKSFYDVYIPEKFIEITDTFVRIISVVFAIILTGMVLVYIY